MPPLRRLLLVILAGAIGVLALAQERPMPPATATASQTAPVEPVEPTPVDAPMERWPADAPTPEQVLYAQPRLLDAALEALTPRVAGRPNLYVLAFAGDGGEDVFLNEAEYAARLFPQRYGPAAHVLVLANHPATLETRPLASWSNLERALQGLDARMQPDDILLIYLTSHGSDDHVLLVDMDPLPLDQIGAEDLAGILAGTTARWKVLVVNACYAGGFIPALANEDTLVLTAARADRSAFGCGSDSDLTWFGKAWLVDGLNHQAGFVAAFHTAQREVADWERASGFPPSEPQIALGGRIAPVLDAWQRSVHPGPTLAFRPPYTGHTAGR